MPSAPKHGKVPESAATAGGTDYEAHFHHAACGYLVLTTDGFILDVNRTLLTWTGHSREKLLGTNVVDLLPIGDQVLYAAYAVPQLAVSGCYNEMAAELVSAAGEHIPVLLSGVRSKSENKGDDIDVDRIAVFNASERRRHERELLAALRKAEAAEAARAAAEEELREKQKALVEKDRVLKASLAASKEREALLNTVLNAVDVGLLVVDKDGDVVLTNAHLKSAWTRVAGEIAPGRARPFFGPDRVTPLCDAESPLRRAAAGESFSNQLLWFGPLDGGHQTALSVSARPIKTDGALSGSVVAYTDVSPLVTALAAQEEFVASVSHELRTPLTSIMGYLDLALDEEGSSPEVTSALQVALRNSERLLALVSDLLSVASGAQKIDRRPVNLAEIVRSGIVSMAPKARANQVDLVTEIPETLTVEVDPQRLAQVVDNLLSNAVKYSPDGGTVRVALSEEGQEIRLEVSDTGIGMDEGEQDKVFTKFFRAHRAVTSAVPGVGLGLVITKSILEAHGGGLSFVSSPGQGSVFTVSLPLTAEGRT
ncbi:ATP-binding protein [Arthrobacter sp. zg-Y820]|uniref:PAS domain-containing sensor histidine kinase n=1 Tax=unclassified Arthrobacter TaxID=235627 RepID=UPI001E5F796A|nr:MULTISPECIES: ATP-binding protein [unclassified Arthrobacter]MCC9197588.1 PAS domain S-box protein [Arthrobacter sp. zg-Y820]MDK1280455.1 ATP-binding protein [Arthrobacter sp. zg.Y820]WIB10901.1 ATP-binding protein [Arthrobacter sp. zg-Y820]